MAFAEDLSGFFTDFGISIPFTRDAVPVVTALLILDAPASEIAVYDRSFYDEKFYEARVIGSNVTLLGIASEIGILQLNDVATISASPWYVTGLEPDGTGLMTLHLSVHQA